MNLLQCIFNVFHDVLKDNKYVTPLIWFYKYLYFSSDVSIGL